MLPNLFTWIPLPDLPQVPEHFVKQGLDLIANPPAENQNFTLGLCNQEYMDRKLIRNGQVINTRCQVNYNMGNAWAKWVRENIFPVYQETGIRVSVGNSDTTGPHVDNPGKLRFFYLVDSGGDDAETVFYMKPGDPVIFNMDTWNQVTPYSHDNIDELIVLERARFPLNTWVLFNGYILHGVNNVTSSRINFNVSILTEQLKIQAKYSG
jgi:hypothetical protein